MYFFGSGHVNVSLNDKWLSGWMVGWLDGDTKQGYNCHLNWKCLSDLLKKAETGGIVKVR